MFYFKRFYILLLLLPMLLWVNQATAQQTPGKIRYDASCGNCHNSGILQAPGISPGDKANWETRLESSGGLEGLYNSADMGPGQMPPRSSFGISQQEFNQAIDYMLQAAGVSITSEPPTTGLNIKVYLEGILKE